MMPAPAEFLDTNILVYAFTTDPRAAITEQLLGKGCVISIQGLNEFANVARRKPGMSWEETNEALEDKDPRQSYFVRRSGHVFRRASFGRALRIVILRCADAGCSPPGRLRQFLVRGHATWNGDRRPVADRQPIHLMSNRLPAPSPPVDRKSVV